jgi:tungstate transport system substrate-binding protein
MTHLTPADAVKAADATGAYLLIDRSTLLRQTALQTITSTTVFIEPMRAEDQLMNSCFALYARTTTDDRSQAARQFIDYLLSDRGQEVVSSYGVAETGVPLFAPVSEGYAKVPLRGGAPAQGKWQTKSTS